MQAAEMEPVLVCKYCSELLVACLYLSRALGEDSHPLHAPGRKNSKWLIPRQEGFGV